MDPNLLTILAAVLGFVAIAGLGFVFAGPGRSSTSKRTQAIAQRSRAETRARPSAPDPAMRRKQILKTLKDNEKRQRKATVSLTARLMQAGLAITPKTFWMVSAGVGVLMALVLLVMGQKLLIVLVLALVAGLGLPRWVLGFLAKRRAKKFVADFPDAADIIVRGIKSGLPVHECLNIIAKETPEPLATEFRKLVENISMGLTMDQALEKMQERMPIQELRFFAIVLGIQQKTGGNLAEALSNLSVVLRSRKLMREKIKAMSSEATASAMIIGSLPPAVMTLITITSPAYLGVLFTEPTGKLLLLGAATWMGLGVLVMRKMINFKL